MNTINQTSLDEMDGSSLLDCYRIALDFGMPAALRAYEKLKLEPTSNYVDPSVNIDDNPFNY